MISVSIIIPCRNEEQYIGQCLQSIVNCNYPKNSLSVFVCDGLSDDHTPEIVREFATAHHFIHYLQNEHKTTPFALNLGLKANDADIKIILGAHAEIYPDFIDNCIKAFSFGKDIGCVGGIIENVYASHTAEIIGKAMSSSFGVGNAHFRTGGSDGFVDTVAFGAYKKEVFEKIGYFDEELIRNQDDEFNFRLLKSGFKIYLYKQIRSKYYVRSSYSKLFNQYYQYGYWKVYVNKKHRTVTTLRQLVPLFFMLFLFGGGLFSFMFKTFGLFYAAIIVLYLLAGLVSGFGNKSGFNTAINMVRCFFILHFSYGLGYLKGITDFFVFNKSIKKEESLSR